MMLGVDHTQLAVTFEEIRLKRATFLTREESHLTIMIQRGEFELFDNCNVAINEDLTSLKWKV